MNVEFGRDVFSSDNHKVGEVAGVVVDGATFKVTRLMVDKGHGEDLLVDIQEVTSDDKGKISLDLNKADADKLPVLVKQQHVTPNRVADGPLIMPASGVGGPVIYDNPDTGAAFGGNDWVDAAPIDTFRLSIESNLLESEVTLRKGTDVIASDYNKVGTVDEIVSSHDGVISTIVARAGFLFSHDIAVPMSAVKSFGTDKIRLSISKDDAEKARR